MQAQYTALFTPGGVYDSPDFGLLEYISTSGKHKTGGPTAEARGLRFYSINDAKIVVVTPDELDTYFPIRTGS